MDLTDEKWAIPELFIPVEKRRADGKGCPRLNNRIVFDGTLLILRTGVAWQDLPDRYLNLATCQRRFQEWQG